MQGGVATEWDHVMLGRIVTLLLLLTVGCDAASSPFLPVRGKVAYRGVPVQGGLIVFTPDARRGAHGAIAMGEIQTDGSYSLRTEKSFGAAPGWYRVTVAALGGNSVHLQGDRYPIPPSLLPERYRDPELSQLSCEIKPERANEIDFNLD
jgi:hypothetical protein